MPRALGDLALQQLSLRIVQIDRSGGRMNWMMPVG
jgi:hypothetical protein